MSFTDEIIAPCLLASGGPSGVISSLIKTPTNTREKRVTVGFAVKPVTWKSLETATYFLHVIPTHRRNSVRLTPFPTITPNNSISFFCFPFLFSSTTLSLNCCSNTICMVHISKITPIFYQKSIKYPFFHHFDFRNGFYRSKLGNRQHLGVAVGAEVGDHCHWNALTSLIFAGWGLLSSLDNG